MKAHTEYLTFHTKKRRELVHLTPTLEPILARSGIAEGMMLVSAMHITAGVFVNDDESGLHADIWEWLEGAGAAARGLPAPPHGRGQRRRAPEVDPRPSRGDRPGDARAAWISGPWQRVFYAEFDGQRDKRLVVKVMGE